MPCPIFAYYLYSLNLIRSVRESELKTPLRQFLGANWTALVRWNADCVREGGAKNKPFGVWIGVDHPHDLPVGWSKNLMFHFVLVNRFDESRNVDSIRNTVFRFNRALADRNTTFLDQGFAQCFFIDPKVLLNPVEGYVDDFGRVTIHICLELIFERTRPPLNHDPKKVTGMVGLENQGATCYLNALLQMLYNITEFRKAVYLLPVPETSVTVDSSTTLALQSIFHNLQVKDCEVNTRDLTKAFGWTSSDAFMQQDVQEMLRVLLDKLEEKMNGTVVDGAIKRLFCGKVRSFIRCVNVTYQSARDEDFYDIQLDVKGCKNVNESFVRYVEKEMLDGDNKYDAGPEFGKQDAEKGVMFMQFPPVLTMHLKRFAFDFERMGFTKIHDRYEFPVLLNLNEYISPDADDAVKAVDHTYELHSVLVHSGDVHGGHYYAYIRPANKHEYGKNPTNDGGKWYMFNDENVYEVHKKDAVDLCFGGRGGGGGYGVSYEHMASAYMLVYVRVDSGTQVMAPSISDSQDIPPALSLRLDGQQQKEMLERYNFILDEQFTEVYYWMESDVAMFSKYYDSPGCADFVSIQQKRKIIVPRQSSYLGVYMKLLEDLNLKPWQLWIFPFSHNQHNPPYSTLQMNKRNVFPLKALDDITWFYNGNGNCRFLNTVPDGSYMYVHITNQFDPDATAAIGLDHAAIEAAYLRARDVEKGLVQQIHDVCVCDKNPFHDDALNAKPFNYTYGCGLGCHPWALSLLKNDHKTLREELFAAQRDFCFKNVMVHVAAVAASRRLSFFKTYDPHGYMSFKCPPICPLLSDTAVVLQGRIITDVRGDYLADGILTDEEEQAEGDARLALLTQRANTKHEDLVSGYTNKACVIRHIGSHFVDRDQKVESLVGNARSFIRQCYEMYLNGVGSDGSRFTVENVEALLERYWHPSLLEMHQFPFPHVFCSASPNAAAVSKFTTAAREVVPMSSISMADLSDMTIVAPSTFYFSHYSAELSQNSDQQIVNMSQYDLTNISVKIYMSYLWHLRTLTVIPDESSSSRDVLTRLSRESLLDSKKKRSRSNLASGGVGAGTGMSSEYPDSPVATGTELGQIKEEGEAAESGEDPLTRQFSIPAFDINTGVSLKAMFDAVAELFGPHQLIDPQRLLLVPIYSRVSNVNWQYIQPGAFSTTRSSSLPPLVPLHDVSLYQEGCERKFRKYDTLMFRVTPFATTVNTPAADGADKRTSLLDVQQRQFEISINDSRILSLRKHFISLFRILTGMGSSDDFSPLSPGGEDEDAAVVSDMMQSRLNTSTTAGKRLKGESDRVSPMHPTHSTNPLSNPASLEITTSCSITSFGTGEQKYVCADADIALDCNYMEDLYGLLWPLSCTSALPSEFISLKKVYVRVDGRSDSSIGNLLKTLRNTIGVPVHASNDPNVSNIKRGQVSSQPSLTATKTETRDEATDSTTVTTTTIRTQPVNAPYVSDSTGTTNFSDHRWLNAILSQWLEQCSGDSSLGAPVATATCGSKFGPSAGDAAMIASAVGKLSRFLRGSTLMLYRYDSSGVINYIYNNAAGSIEYLPRCWMDVQTCMAEAAPAAAGPQPAPTAGGHVLPRAQVVKHLDYVPGNACLAVQFVGANEHLLWEGAVAGLRSFGIYVCNIQALTPHPATAVQTKWTTLDVELYGEPLMSYICETDTLETLTKRICALSPAASGKSDLKIGIVKHSDVAPLWFSEAAEAMRGIEGEAEETLWELLTRLHPDVTSSFEERKTKHVQYHNQRGVRANMLPVLFPLTIGIERATLVAPAAAKSGSR